MKQTLAAILIAAASGAVFAAENSKAKEAVVQANTDFARVLYEEMRREAGEDSNILFSPLSISSAMAIAMEGANGGTATQIAEALRLEGQGNVPSGFSEILGSLQSENPRLEIANALVLTGKEEPNPEYRELLSRDFKAEIFDGDLARINAWVSDKTQGKIPKILDELSGQSVFVILNAVYFMGKWAAPFDSQRTHDAPFYAGIVGDKEKQVRMMFQNGEFRMLQGQGFRAVALPYKGNGKRWSMVVILPDEKNGLINLEGRLRILQLGGLLSAVCAQNPVEMDVFMPKFKIETDYNLVPALTSLGVEDAFSEMDADFSKMYGEKGAISIGRIIHKAYIDVDEEKTEAAAATAVEMVASGMPMPAAEFRADHPFIFALYDEESQAVLFLGRMVDPSSEEGTISEIPADLR